LCGGWGPWARAWASLCGRGGWSVRRAGCCSFRTRRTSACRCPGPGERESKDYIKGLFRAHGWVTWVRITLTRTRDHGPTAAGPALAADGGGRAADSGLAPRAGIAAAVPPLRSWTHGRLETAPQAHCGPGPVPSGWVAGKRVVLKALEGAVLTA
jgi:hypothetical protein